MFQNLPGFRDFYPEDCSIRNSIFQEWRAVAQQFAFDEFDGPLLEPLELLTAKSGDEIVSQLFNFEDKGGRAVTLRPELTPSLARMVGAKAGSLRKPVKWFSIGENFRYERKQKGRLRSFYQLNADILGEPGPAADAEIIALLIQSLRTFGLTEEEFCLRLSDRTLWLLFLEGRGIVDDQALAVLGILDKFERESPEKILGKLEALSIDDASGLLSSMTELKQLDDFEKLKSYLSGCDFSDTVVEKMEKRFSEFSELLRRLNAMGLSPFIRLDLGIVRGLAYYTGFVFEAFQIVGKGRALAGGGRYDHLVKKLGGPDMPAVGFGMGDVTLRDLLEERDKLNMPGKGLDAFIVIGSENEEAAALEDLMRLRQEGISADYAFKASNMGKQFKVASQLGARYALVYGQAEVESGQVTLKDLNARTESKISRETLCSDLKQMLALLPES